MYVKASLITSLKVAMNARMFQVIQMSAVVFFSDKSSREDTLDMSYEESHSAQDTLRNVSQRSDMGIQRIQNDSKSQPVVVAYRKNLLTCKFVTSQVVEWTFLQIP